MPRKKAVHGFGKYDVQINNVLNVINNGYHNAFVDLCIWHDHYWMAYRRAQWHDPIPPGDVVIARSPDGVQWEEMAVIDSGGDDRDPKFVTDQDDWLTVYFGTYYKRWEGKTLGNSNRDLITCGVQSRNGTAWSAPYQIYRPNYWLWSTQKGYNDYTYGMAYHFGVDYANSLQLLYRRKKRFGSWETVTTAMLSTQDYLDLSEPALFALDEKHEEFICIARSSNCTLVGASRRPYTKWLWKEIPTICHCPVVCKAEGRIFVAGRTRLDNIPGLSGEEEEKAVVLRKMRDYQYTYETDEDVVDRLTPNGKPKDWLTDVYKCVLFEFLPKKPELKYILTVPSSQDCAYPGMVYNEASKELVMAYYSQHEYGKMDRGIPRPADIFVARLSLTESEI